MAEGEAPAPAALIEPDERSTVSLWSSTKRQANKVDEIAFVLKKMTALETKLADLEGERIRVRERQDVLPSGPLQLHGALLECAKEVRVLTGLVVGRVDSRSASYYWRPMSLRNSRLCLQRKERSAKAALSEATGIVVLTHYKMTRGIKFFQWYPRQDARNCLCSARLSVRAVLFKA